MLQVKFIAKCQFQFPSAYARYERSRTRLHHGSSTRRRPWARGGGRSRRCRSGDRRARSQRRKLSRHFTDSPSSRSYRRGRATFAPRRGPRVALKDPRDDVSHRPLRDGERCDLADLGLSFEILHVPGHTVSHIAFWGHGALFCGDTLFSAGCGRMFEGTPTQMSASLSRLTATCRERHAGLLRSDASTPPPT